MVMRFKPRPQSGVKPRLVHLVAHAEFDELKGTTLRDKYPRDASIGDISENHLAEFAIPEGGHLHEKDISYMIVNVDGEVLYGFGYFARRSDSSMKRGMRQAAVIVIARSPRFATFEPMMIDAVSKLLVPNPPTKDVLKALFEALNTAETNHKISLWGKDHTISMRELALDEFEHASLTWFVQTFRADTMLVWYALLRQERVMFSGNTASEVGRCCITAPLLVAPLTGFAPSMCPYLPLAMLDAVKHRDFGLFGVTNGFVFNNKTEMYDVLALVTNACVDHQQGFKPSGRDKHFIKDVLNGINDKRGESWVRTQFRNYTEQFLERLTSGRLADQQKRLLGASSDKPFTKTMLYSRFLTMHAELMKTRTKASAQLSGVEILRELNQMDTKGKQFNLKLMQLAGAPTNISDIEDLVDAGAVAALAPSLFAQDSTEVKYTINFLGAVATTIKGQVAILSENLLPRIVGVVSDVTERPNVRTAACACLLKISSLFIGTKALVDHEAVNTLWDTVQSGDGDLQLKTHAANALLQIYRMLPNLQPSRDPELMANELKSADHSYIEAILLLMDTCRFPIRGKVPVSAEAQARVQGLSAMKLEENLPDKDTRFNVTMSFQADLIQSPFTILQFVEAGGVRAVWQNILETSEHEPLRYVSWDLLSVVVDTHSGASCVHELQIVEHAVLSIAEVQTAECLFHTLRFVDVVCQQPSLGQCFVEKNGVQKLVGFVRQHYTKETRMLCVLALSALRYLMRFQPKSYETIRSHLAPLQTLALGSNVDQRSAELDKMVLTLLHLGRVTPVNLDSQAIINEFFQTLSRRGKVLTASETNSVRSTASSVADT